METVLTIVFLAVAAVWVCVKLGYELQMFQQNSYRNERYFKWLGKNYASIDRVVELAALVAIAIIWFTGINKWWLMLPSLMQLLLTIKTLTRKSKVKLKFTSRAKRLYFTSLAIIVIGVVANVIYTGMMGGLLTTAANGILTCIILPIANIILKPVERHINNWYINDAKRILKEHPGLIIVGITGSYGKTSTKHFLETILSQKYNVLMTPGSFNTTMGVVRTIREYLKPTHEVFICEMGAKQIGDIKEICDLVHPKYGILTSVAEQHLDTFKTSRTSARPNLNSSTPCRRTVAHSSMPITKSSKIPTTARRLNTIPRRTRLRITMLTCKNLPIRRMALISE